MVIVIVPPVGPPIPVIVGRALRDGTVHMDQRFKVGVHDNLRTKIKELVIGPP